MRQAARFGWAVAVGLAANGAFAQTGAGTTSTGAAGGGTSATGGSTGLNGTSAPTSTFTAADLTSVPTIGSTSNSGVLSPSNQLGAFYANPTFSGGPGSSESTAPGGFGVLWGGASSSGGVSTGAARTTGTTTNSTRAPGATTTGTATGSTFTGGTTGTARGAATGATGTTGAGGRAGTTGATGATGARGASATMGVANVLGTTANTLANPVGGQVVPLPRAIAYVAVMRFPIAVQTPVAMQANLQTVFDQSTQISTSRGVQVTAQTGGVVVLRGAVKDEDEARLAEGMVRLTPGIRDVRNELTFPKTTSTP